VFAIAAVFDIVAALLAFFVLRRMSVPSGGEALPTESLNLVRETASVGASD
jgi:hypothetical protein